VNPDKITALFFKCLFLFWCSSLFTASVRVISFIAFYFRVLFIAKFSVTGSFLFLDRVEFDYFMV
jgi:hypothetical protein